MEAFYKVISQAVIPLHHVTDHNSAQMSKTSIFKEVGHLSEHFLLIKVSSSVLIGGIFRCGKGGGLGWMFMFPGSGTVLREHIPPPPEHD